METISKTATNSGYKKTEVKTALIEAIRNGKVENACYWSAEMVCSSLFLELWEILFLILGKYIHCANPLVTQYYRRRYELFRNIMNDMQESNTEMIEVRNNATIRQLFAELISTAALSDKKPSYEEIRVPDEEIEDLVSLSVKLKADRPDYISEVLKPDDPKELHIGVNEFCYHLKVTRNMNSACYWLEWIFGFAALCKKRGEPIFCAKRTEYADIEKKHQKDIVWILWETILYAAKTCYSLQTTAVTTLNALFELFRIRYAGISTCKKRKYLLYFAISLITENVIYKSELVSETNKAIIQVATENIDKIYQEFQIIIAKREKQEKQANLEDSLRKINLISKYDIVSVEK
jgi:hypothetical protein